MVGVKVTFNSYMYMTEILPIDRKSILQRDLIKLSIVPIAAWMERSRIPPYEGWLIK